MLEKWQYFLDAGNYNWKKYNSLEEAMNDEEIYSSIFSNSNCMTYLVENSDLISNIKELSNYSEDLVPYLLSSNVYTDLEKYNYGLPFYIYKQGTYNSKLFSKVSDYSYEYNNGCTRGYKNELSSSGYMNISLTSCMNDCARVILGSKKAILVDNYNNFGTKVSYYSSTVSNGLVVFLTKSTPTIDVGAASLNGTNLIVKPTKVDSYYVNIRDLSGNVYPLLRIRKCENGGSFTMTARVTHWWFE